MLRVQALPRKREPGHARRGAGLALDALLQCVHVLVAERVHGECVHAITHKQVGNLVVAAALAASEGLRDGRRVSGGRMRSWSAVERWSAGAVERWGAVERSGAVVERGGGVLFN